MADNIRPDWCYTRFLLDLPDVLAMASAEERPGLVAAMNRHTLQRSFAYVVVRGLLPIVYHVLALKQDLLLDMDEDSLAQMLLVSSVGLLAAAYIDPTQTEIRLQGWHAFKTGTGAHMPEVSMTTRIQIMQALDAAAPITLNLAFRRISPLFAIASSIPILGWSPADCRDFIHALSRLRHITFDAREYAILRMRCEELGLRHYLPPELLTQREDVERRAQVWTRRDTLAEF